MARRTWWKVGALLAAMMVFLTMLPSTALAAAPSGQVLYVGNVQISSTGYWTTDSEGKVTSAGATQPSDNYIYYDVANNALTLHNATIKESVSTNTSTIIAGAAIGVLNQNGDAELTITLEGTNTIAEVGKGIYVLAISTGGATLTITGDGSLDASAWQTGIWVQSNNGDAALFIQNAKVEATGTSYGVNVQPRESSTASLTVDGGSLTASGSPGILYDSSGSGTVPNTTTLTISNSAIVDARGGGIGAGSLLNLKEVSPVDDSVGIVFDGNQSTVYGNVTLQEDLTIGEGESLTLDDGASLDAGDYDVIVDGGTLDDSIKNSLGDSVKYPPTITTASLPNGEAGTTYNQTLEATGSDTITWSVTSGSLPAGLTLDRSTGEIAGTPTTVETSNFTVKAENDYGNDSTQFTLTIETAANVPVNSVSLSPSTLNLVENETGTLTATVLPNNATNKDVTWESSNTSVATVDASGLVTAVSAGTTNITATADGNKTATCTVTVVAKTYSISSSPTSLDFGSVYTGYAQPAAQTVVVTNTGNQDVTLVQPASANFEISALSAIKLAPNDTATFSVQPRSGLAAGTYSEQIVVTGTAADGGSATCAATLSFSVRTPYVPPRPTGPDWGDVADDIADAEPGSTVTVDMDGKTVLPGEVLDELAGSDVTLALDMGDGLFWEIYGGDVPADAEYDDVDLSVALGGDDIPADVVNLVTGESGSVQVSLEHDGPFSFELTLVAPLGEDAAGLVANLYRYDDEAGSLGYEATAQVDGEGVARLPFDHASSWLVALDSRTHALPFADAPEGEWYSEAIRWAWLGGAMTGYEGTDLFGTGDPLTRAQLAQVLYNRAGAPEAEPADGFADVDAADWFAPAVAWASSEGLLTGYGDDVFGPDDALTREQLAVVFWRMAGEPAAEADLSEFPDGDETSAWAVEAMEWAVSTGLLEGYTDTGRLDPTGDLTRAQAATVFFRQAEAATE